MAGWLRVEGMYGEIVAAWREEGVCFLSAALVSPPPLNREGGVFMDNGREV